METFAVVISTVALLAAVAWFAMRLTAFVRADGYGFRAASGLPRDWSPSPDLPSTSYVEKPHR